MVYTIYIDLISRAELYFNLFLQDKYKKAIIN